jgi:hypothetical protein
MIHDVLGDDRKFPSPKTAPLVFYPLHVLDPRNETCLAAHLVGISVKYITSDETSERMEDLGTC